MNTPDALASTAVTPLRVVRRPFAAGLPLPWVPFFQQSPATNVDRKVLVLSRRTQPPAPTTNAPALSTASARSPA
jgi:hypothetical protein